MNAPGLNIAFFGSSLVSAYWNGAATYYRGIVRALAERGHRVTFYEPDAYQRQQHRDIADPDWARVVVYPPEEAEVERCLEEAAAGADVIVKASGVGVNDALLERRVVELKDPSRQVVFWDVDAPATLERMAGDPHDPFRALVPRYDLVLTYGGGTPVTQEYAAFGAKRCIPIYNALDPTTHHPVPPEPRFEADLGFLGNRLPDREKRVEEFFLAPARKVPHLKFLLGGNGWEDKPVEPNVVKLGHLPTADHNAFNCTARAVLNISRESMARFGFSPATRVFEACGAEACVISDAWEGMELFLEPGREVLIVHSGDELADLIRSLTPEQARRIARAGKRRILAEHTYRHRVGQVEAALGFSRLQRARP